MTTDRVTSLNEAALQLDEALIQRHGPGGLIEVCWRQWHAERQLTARGIQFRSSDPATCAAAYAAMRPEEFDAVNGRQEWANWRTIPQGLHGRVPDRPLQVIDLGCGTGGSTRVLACYCPAGSRIVGYELTEHLAAIARQRTYRHHSGAVAAVEFVVQGVTETLRQPDGTPVAERSIDLVNASGVVGHHLTGKTIEPLLAELQRIMTPTALALLDVGPTLDEKELTALMTARGFAKLGRQRGSLFDLHGQVAFQRSP
jgi:SAM-dependent methyltransferase